jgi:preprotein translocase subunit YajC
MKLGDRVIVESGLEERLGTVKDVGERTVTVLLDGEAFPVPVPSATVRLVE